MSASPRIAAVVLAAGASKRLGRAKQLVTYGGRPLVRIAADAALGATGSVAVVVDGTGGGRAGAGAGVVEALDGLPVVFLTNRDADEGMASSVRCAAAWAAAERADAILVLVCDQPLLTSAHLTRLEDALTAQGATMAASRYSGVVGVPALFARHHFAELAALRGDDGAKTLLRRERSHASRVAVVDFPEGAFDVDTRADVESLSNGPLRPRREASDVEGGGAHDRRTLG